MSKTSEKEASEGNILDFFCLDTYNAKFLIENVTQKWTQWGPFFQKPGHYFLFSKRAGEASTLPPALRLWVWLNMHRYPWICLNILENASINCSDYARALNLHNYLRCSTGFWRCLGYVSGYGSIMLEYDSIYLNMAEYC